MTDFAFNYISAALPEIFLAVSILVLLMVGVFTPKEYAARSVAGLSVVTLAITFIFMLVEHQTFKIGFAFPYGTGPDGQPVGHFYIADWFAFYAKSLVLLASATAIVLAEDTLKKIKLHKFEFYVLVLIATLGMMLMTSAAHLITLYMGLELMSFSLYVLASFWRDNSKSSEAGLKYFVLGSLASGILLFGLSYIYGIVGDLSFAAIDSSIATIHQGGEHVLPLTVALVMVITAMAFKLSAVPFHMWTPDVYEGSPTPVTAFMSAGPKIAAFALLMRLLIEPFAALAADWTQVIIALSILTMAVGAYMAIVQQNLKRLLAYSSIGHVGFMLVGLVGGTIQGVHAVLMYLTIYGIMTMGAFGMLMLLRRKDVYLETIDDIAGLSEKAPAYAFMLLVLFFSIAGIPPLAGFFAKFYVFGAAVAAGYTWLAIVAVVLSVVSAFYVLRVIRAMYFDKGLNKPIDMNAPMPMRMAVVAAVLFVVGFIFFMQPIDAISYKAAESLFVSASL